MLSVIEQSELTNRSFPSGSGLGSGFGSGSGSGSSSFGPSVDGHASTTRATLDQFEVLVRARRTTRQFRADPLAPGLLERLLDAARWAPSGYNLQPTHFFIVDADSTKSRLFPAAMKQNHVLRAPVTVVFAGDRKVYEHDFEHVMDMEQKVGSLTPEYEARLRTFVPLAFRRGPLALSWMWKAAMVSLAPLIRLIAPLPQLPAIEQRAWLSKQASLAAMNFMLAATAAGLATVPMEGFDDAWVRHACDIPKHFDVILLVSVGYADGPVPLKSRFPLGDRLHYVNA